MGGDYTVKVKTLSGETTLVEVKAFTHLLAAGAAEHMVVGSTMTDVYKHWIGIGRCCRCQVHVFAGDNPRRTPQGELRCLECT